MKSPEMVLTQFALDRIEFDGGDEYQVWTRNGITGIAQVLRQESKDPWPLVDAIKRSGKVERVPLLRMVDNGQISEARNMVRRLGLIPKVTPQWVAKWRGFREMIRSLRAKQ